MGDVTRHREVGFAEWRCRVCGSPLIATPSGSTCPDGCIGLMHKMPAAVKRVNHAILLGVRRITNLYGKYYLDSGERVEKVKQINREVKPKELSTVALEGTQLWLIRRTTDSADD